MGKYLQRPSLFQKCLLFTFYLSTSVLLKSGHLLVSSKTQAAVCHGKEPRGRAYEGVFWHVMLSYFGNINLKGTLNMAHIPTKNHYMLLHYTNITTMLVQYIDLHTCSECWSYLLKVTVYDQPQTGGPSFQYTSSWHGYL